MQLSSNLKMFERLIIIHFFVIVASQSPPIQVGNTHQYITVKINTEMNISCPFKDVEFYRWINPRAPTLFLSEQRELKTKLTSFTKSEIYECEAVNGYGKRTAVFVIKGIDTNSKQFEIDCQLRENGPCFLVSGISNDFEFTVEENSKIAMDCRAVLNSSNNNGLIYSWKKMPLPDNYEMKQPNSRIEQEVPISGQFMNEVPPIGRIEYNSIEDMSKWGPIVIFEKVSRKMDGAYQCVVAYLGTTIKRTFRLRIKEIRRSSTIEGPLNQSIKAEVGGKQILSCKANTKPKWGKKLDNTEETLEPDEVIKWGGSRYKMLQGTLDLQHKANEDSLKDSKYYENNLIFDNIQPYHSGEYVCTVLTSSALEHKYVNLSVEAGLGNDNSKKNNNFSIYIAVPTTIFIICLITIIYCLVHRRIRQKENFKNRAARGTAATTTNNSSGNGSCSGSRNTTNPRHHMLTTTTNSSKGSQNQFSPNNGYGGNVTTAPGYGPNQPTFSSGYTPALMNYNYTGPNTYIQATNNTPSSTDIDHPCSHHSCMPHTNNCHPVPYDTDSTPSPPPPTSIITDHPVSSMPNVNVTNPNILVPYSNSAGVSLNSYSPNQSSQVYMANITPHGSSSTSVSSPNAIYPIGTQQQQSQQPLYPVGVIYSA